MKTTIDLPDKLVREVKLRAIHDGMKLKDAMADLLRKGLDAPDGAPTPRPTVQTHPQTGLPYIECLHEASEREEMDAQRAADVLLEQEAAWHHEAGR